MAATKKVRKYRKFTPEEEQKIIESYRAVGCSETLKNLKINNSNLYNVLRKYDIPIKRKEVLVSGKSAPKVKRKKSTYQTIELSPPPPPKSKGKVFVIYGEDPSSIAEVLKGLK